LRVVAADASVFLHAGMHSSIVAERAMLVEALDRLGPDDVLVLDRGYPAAWPVALLSARGIRFVMRCDNDGGWSATKQFIRSGAAEASVVLFIGDVHAAIVDAITQLARNSQRFLSGRSQPRPPCHVKPHPSCAYKG
jgi:hypothetical protein